MKANELMIGDWVLYHEKPYQILGIKEDDDSIYRCLITGPEGFNWWIKIADFQPIPLTPEILEKNGFRWDGSGQRSMCYITPFDREDKTARYNIYVGLKRKTIEVFVAHPQQRTPGWRKSNKVYLEVCGCYAHELQHALRLCGIEKEIKI